MPVSVGVGGVVVKTTGVSRASEGMNVGESVSIISSTVACNMDRSCVLKLKDEGCALTGAVMLVSVCVTTKKAVPVAVGLAVGVRVLGGLEGV